MSANLETRLTEVQNRIAAASFRAGRIADDICLVAVSKTKPFDDIAEAYSAGQRDFGENRLEELWTKVELAREYGLVDIRWHMIGSIQSRKTPQTIGPFALIHSVDRQKIASRISRDAVAAESVIDILLEVNVSCEESKHGFSPSALRLELESIIELPGVRVRGSMTMAPIAEDPEDVRTYFRDLRTLRDNLANRVSDSGFTPSFHGYDAGLRGGC